MQNNVFVVAFILGCLFLITCSEMVDEEGPITQRDLKKLCDGSDEIVLRIRTQTPQLGPGDLLFYENGRNYFYLTGKCEFWLWGGTPKSGRGGKMVQRIQHGSFDEEGEIKFLKMLRFDLWKEANGLFFNEAPVTDTWFTIAKTATIEFAFTKNGKTETEKGRLYLKLEQGLAAASTFAYSRAKPIEKGNLRVFVAETLYDDYWARAEHPPIFIDWPLDVDVLELSKQQNPYCYGKSFLVTGDDAEVFWNAREQYTREVANTFPLLMGVEDKYGAKHEIYIRGVLPFENELGLIPLDGNFNGDSCQ